MHFGRSVKNLVDLLVDLPLNLALLLVDNIIELTDLFVLLWGDLVDLLADLVRPRLDQIMSVEDFASPVHRGWVNVDISIVFYALLRLNNVEEDFGFIKNAVRSDNILEAGKDHELVLQRERRSLLDHAIEGIAHDGNKHVKEGDLHDERRNEE